MSVEPISLVSELAPAYARRYLRSLPVYARGFVDADDLAQDVIADACANPPKADQTRGYYAAFVRTRLANRIRFYKAERRLPHLPDFLDGVCRGDDEHMLSLDALEDAGVDLGADEVGDEGRVIHKF